MRCVVSCDSISFPWLVFFLLFLLLLFFFFFLLCSERPDSQTYRKMDVTMERISHILELREMLLSFQTGFNFVDAAVVCAILESISGLKPSLAITESGYVKLVIVSSFRVS